MDVYIYNEKDIMDLHNNIILISLPNKVLEDMLFPGRGGGLSILINSITMVTVNVNNCKFVKNQATSFGGGAHSFGRIVQSHNYIPVM